MSSSLSRQADLVIVCVGHGDIRRKTSSMADRLTTLVTHWRLARPGLAGTRDISRAMRAS